MNLEQTELAADAGCMQSPKRPSQASSWLEKIKQITEYDSANVFLPDSIDAVGMCFERQRGFKSLFFFI
jgi:hypothetical protein